MQLWDIALRLQNSLMSLEIGTMVMVAFGGQGRQQNAGNVINRLKPRLEP